MRMFILIGIMTMWMNDSTFAQEDLELLSGINEGAIAGVDECPRETTQCFKYNEELLRSLCGAGFNKADPLPNGGKTVCCKPTEKCVTGNGLQGIDLCTHPRGCVGNNGTIYGCGEFRGGSNELTGVCRPNVKLELNEIKTEDVLPE